MEQIVIDKFDACQEECKRTVVVIISKNIRLEAPKTPLTNYTRYKTLFFN